MQLLLSSLLLSTAATATATASASATLEIYTTSACSGTPNATVDISQRQEHNCKGCWDRCAAGLDDARSFRLRVPTSNGTTKTAPVRAAVNINCVGQYRYAGGWSDASVGGVFSSDGDGCYDGGASAIVLCSATIPGMQVRQRGHVYLLLLLLLSSRTPRCRTYTSHLRTHTLGRLHLTSHIHTQPPRTFTSHLTRTNGVVNTPHPPAGRPSRGLRPEPGSPSRPGPTVPARGLVSHT